jgi:hypothetical protein
VNIQNRKYLEVYDSKDVEGQKVTVKMPTKGINQKWKIIYVDKAAKTETKGLNEEFGFHINRPFYIRSRMPFQRVAECHGRNNVWLKRWRKNSKQQQWFFDEVTKTIRNNLWKTHSLDI